MFGWVYALLHKWSFGQFVGGVIVLLTGTSQSPLEARYPVNIGLFFTCMAISWFCNRCIFFEVEIAVQLASQAYLMNNSGVWSFGTR